MMMRMQSRLDSEHKRKMPVLKIPVYKNVEHRYTKAQEKEETLNGIQIYLKESKIIKRTKNDKISEFVLKRGLLYRHVTTGKRQCEQLVVPQLLTLGQAILKLAHSGTMSGHLGISKTRDRILAHFFWPGGIVAVTRSCRSRDMCQRTVDKGKVSNIKLGEMPLIGGPFSRMVVDLVGPLEPRSLTPPQWQKPWLRSSAG